MIQQALVVVPKLRLSRIELCLDQTKSSAGATISISNLGAAVGSRWDQDTHVAEALDFVANTFNGFSKSSRYCWLIRQLCATVVYNNCPVSTQPEPNQITNEGEITSSSMNAESLRPPTHRSYRAPIPCERKDVPIIARVRPVPAFDHGDPWGQGRLVIPRFLLGKVYESSLDKTGVYQSRPLAVRSAR